MDVSGRRGARPIQVAVGVQPEHAAGPGSSREATEGAQCNRVVAPEHEGQEALLDRVRDVVRDPLAGLLDLRQEANPLIADGARLRDGRHHIPPVEAAPAELLDSRLEPCVADRRGAHVHSAAARTQIEPGTDHRHRLEGFLSVHAGKASVGFS